MLSRGARFTQHSKASNAAFKKHSNTQPPRLKVQCNIHEAKDSRVKFDEVHKPRAKVKLMLVPPGSKHARAREAQPPEGTEDSQFKG